MSADRLTHGSDCITSTPDTGGNNTEIIENMSSLHMPAINQQGRHIWWISIPTDICYFDSSWYSVLSHIFANWIQCDIRCLKNRWYQPISDLWYIRYIRVDVWLCQNAPHNPLKTTIKCVEEVTDHLSDIVWDDDCQVRVTNDIINWSLDRLQAN